MFKFLEQLADFIVYRILDLPSSSRIAISLDFFIYNTLKIFILILIIGFIIGIIRDLITPHKTKEILSSHKAGMGNIIASLLAVVTPVESFSVVPVFIGFLEAGIPPSIAFTYLITAPITNEVAFALFFGLFGYKIAFIYYAAGIIAGLIGGIILGLLRAERYIEPVIFRENSKTLHCSGYKCIRAIVKDAAKNSINFLKSFWIYILIGVGIAAIIEGNVPSDIIVEYVGKANPYAVPLAVIFVILFYVNIAMALPVIMILVNHSLPIGTVIAFTMALTATSIPELLILKRALKIQLIIIYMAILLGLIILTGYFLNFVFR